MNSSTFALSSSPSPRRISSYSHRRRAHFQQTSDKSKLMPPINKNKNVNENKISGLNDEKKSDKCAPQARITFSSLFTLFENNKTANKEGEMKLKSNPLQCISHCFIHLIYKAFEKEEKTDDLELMINEICGGQEFIYRRQQEIDVLCKNTLFSKQEIKLLYWGWKLACPEGVLNEPIFRDIYAQFFPQAGDSSLYARYVFQAMFGESIAKNEPITFLEYAKALSTLCRGTIMDKITWIFQLYDINHDGRITYDEVYKISVAIYALLGFHVTPSHNYKTYEEHSRKVFAKMDQSSLGYVTFDQFKELCLKNETIITSMQQLNTNSI